MGLNSLGLGFIFTGKDLSAGKVVGDLAGKFSGMDKAALRANESYQRNFATMGVGLGLMATGAAVLAAAFALAGEAGEFEQGLARVGAVAGASASEMRLLHDESLKIATDLSVAPTEAAEGLENLASQGFNARQSLDLLSPSIYLAQGGQISLASSTATVSAAMHVFGLSVDQGANTVDKLLAISNQTALSANDLELAIGTVGRGASLTSQKLDEMLISMGLVKNTGVDASVAAQSVSSALIFMAGRSDKFKELGISVTDSSGKFKDFLSIVTETSGVLETKYTDQAERAAAATDLFSRFGLQAYSAIVQQLSSGIKNETTGAMLHGAEAVAYLRAEMEKASGTAEKFRDRMLDTLEGQKAAFSSTMQTLAVVIGEPFAKAFKPVVKTVVETLKSVVSFINSIPADVKEPLFKAILVVAGLATAFGAVIAGVAAFLVLKPFLVAIGAAFAGMAAALLPVLLYIGALALAVQAVRYVIQNNIGGLGTAWSNFTERVGMGVRGLIQLFTQGGLSGAVMEFFARAENSGLKRFIVSLYQIGFRVVQFFRGLREGFGAGLEAAAPAFERLAGGLRMLGEALGLVSANGTAAAAGIPSQSFAEKGAQIGIAFAKVIEWISDALARGAAFFTGVVEGFFATMSFFSPLFQSIGPTIEWLGSLFWELMQTLGLVTSTSKEGMSGWQMFGKVIGVVAGIVGTILVGAIQLVGWALGGLIMLVDGIIIAFKYLVAFIFRVGEFIGAVINTIVNLVANLIDGVIVSLGTLASKIPAGIRPAWADSLAEANMNARTRINRRVDQDVSNYKHVFGDAVYPAAEESGIRAQDSRASAAAMDRVARMVEKQKQERGPNDVSRVVLQVDGETLASVVKKKGREEAAASFQPVSSPR